MKKLAALAVVLLLAGCAAAPGQAKSGVTVFAAASLTESFEAIADAFAAEHPNVDITFNFGGSSGLATQIVEGAPVDVFAAASGTTMKAVTDAALNHTDPTPFVTNTLEIAVPAGNPGGVTGLADFANPDLVIALCAVEVPCGAASQTVLAKAGVTPATDTIEQDVKAVLTKIELGEVDAGLVYTTDVLAAGDEVEGIEFAEAAEAIGTYPIVRLTDKDAAAAFIEFVLGPQGRAILHDAGFGTP